MRPALLTLVLAVAGCGSPAGAPSTPNGAIPVATTAAPTAARTASPVTTSAPPSAGPSVPEGDVLVTLRLFLTGPGSSAATMGVAVTDEGGDPRTVILCSSPDGSPPCQEGGTFETSLALPEGDHVEVRWFQDFEPDGSNRLYFRSDPFVVSKLTVLRKVSYDIQ